MSGTSQKHEAALSAERLRLAEARLARRRQTDCGPSETARAAMRFVFDCADANRLVTPTDIAEHVGVSTASMTSILQRLRAGGVVFVRNPDDGRSKFVTPFGRDTDLDDVDPLSAQIRRLSQQLSPADAEVLTQFLDQVTAAVERECR